MKLVVFDLDGTLTSTVAVDEECFMQAFEQSLGIETLNTNWSEYQHVTDSGVVREAFAKAFGRAPSSTEISRFVESFVRLLNQYYSASSNRFGEVPGAASLIRGLRADSRWAVAIATGSWERSARFKIEMARIGANDCPAAFAEDGPSREAIVEAAIARARVHYQQNRFERVVSVGDAVWDVRTAKRLGLPFVGVGSEDRAVILRKLGASHVVENFLSYHDCLHSLEGARIPGGAS